MKPFEFGMAAMMAVAAFPVEAQPAKGAAAAFERVREVMASRAKDVKLAGEPDRDFAAMLIAHHEDLIFLARTQLEYGGDRQLRQTAQKILDETQKEIDGVKQWQTVCASPTTGHNPTSLRRARARSTGKRPADFTQLNRRRRRFQPCRRRPPQQRRRPADGLGHRREGGRSC